MTTLKETKAMIRSIVETETEIVPMLWGSPGIGKTSAVRQAAQELGVGFKEVVAHLREPTDILGLPYVVQDAGTHSVAYAPPKVFPNEAKDGKRGIFFIDELPNCVPALQSAWATTILNRGTEAFEFPKGWAFVCAGNRETDRAGAETLVTALSNRLNHIDVEVNLAEWELYATATNIDSRVTSFLHEHDDLLSKFDPKLKGPESKAFPSPRSWEQVSKILKMKMPAAATRTMIKGAVGSGASIMFHAHLELADQLPKIDDVLAGKVDLKKIDNPSIVNMIVFALAARVTQTKTQAMTDKVMDIIDSKLRDEFAVVLLTQLWETVPSMLRNSSSWQKVSDKFAKHLG